MKINLLTGSLIILSSFLIIFNVTAATQNSSHSSNSSQTSNSSYNSGSNYAPPPSQIYQYYAPAPQQPNIIAMLGDGLITRPALLLVTALGTLGFVLTLPFSIPSHSVESAANTMIADPFNMTFNRCLGCSTPLDNNPIN